MERKSLTGLSPRVYEHPRDRKTLDALEGTRGLATIVRKFNEWGIERMVRVECTGSNLRVSEDNLPELFDTVQQASTVLDLPHKPEVYVAPGGEINAFTLGVEHPIVVLSSSAVDSLSADELSFVVGHELGHIKSGHGLYLQLAEFLPRIALMLESTTMGLSGLASTALQLALLNWQRTSELTADRAGLLACQQPNAALTSLVKLAGLPQKYYPSINTEDFIAQARAFEVFEGDGLSRFVKALLAMERTHPWTVMRAHELLGWLDTGDYERLLEAPSGVRALPPSSKGIASFCVRCGQGVPGGQAYCTACGAKVLVVPRSSP